MEERLDAAARAGDIDALYSLMKEDAYVLERIEKVPFVYTPLHAAASAGKVLFAMEIMRLKSSFARKLNQEGHSPIHLALQNEQTKLVLRLLDVDRDLVHVQGREGKTPLHFVAECGVVDLLAEFRSFCPNSIQDLTIRKETALHVAAKSDKLEALKVLLGCLEDVSKDGVLDWCDDEVNTILHVAASRIQIEVVNLLIARGVNVNAVNMAGMTALDISQQPNGLGNAEIRNSLIHAGAFEAAALPRNNCSLHYLRQDERLKDAAKTGDTNILYSLIRNNPFILERFDDIPYADTPLHIAARLGHFSFAMEIMRWKPSFAKKPNQEGLCPIHLATINGHIHTLKQLLSIDKSLARLQGREGKTSLHYAAEKGDTLLLNTLLSACPLSVVDVTDQGDTALHVAIKYSKLEAFFFLLAMIRSTVHEGSTKHERIIMNYQDEKGNTVLHIAAQTNQPQVVKQLLDSGVQVDVKNTEGLTALDVSRGRHAQENTEITEILLNARASSTGSLACSLGASIDHWILKNSRAERVVTSMMRYKRDMSIQLRNLILVVSVLIATITYQTAVSPPTRRDNDKNISCILATATNSSSPNSTISCSMHDSNTNSNVSLFGENISNTILFWTSNIIALFSSLVTTVLLLPSKYTRSLLSVPLYFFVYCYVMTVAITGSGLWSIIASTLFFILYETLIYADAISKRIKQKAAQF